jgi:hypothetical protein
MVDCFGGIRRRGWSVFFAAVVAAAGCTSTDDESPADREACLKLRTHVIDVRLTGMTNVDVEAHRAAFERSLGDDFLDSCGKTFSVRQVKCAVEASDSDAIEACTRTSVPVAH